MQEKKIVEFIKVIRESFHDSFLVYSFGGCYGFYTVLKHSFPIAKPYFETEGKKHIVTKIGKDFYDIHGKKEVEDYGDFVPLNKRDMEVWSVASHGLDMAIVGRN